MKTQSSTLQHFCAFGAFLAWPLMATCIFTSALPAAAQEGEEEQLPNTVAQAGPNKAIAPGSIRVKVVDESGKPAAGATVQVGIMAQEGKRQRFDGRTDEHGMYTFSGLRAGGGQAYRVNVPYLGATYSSTPFQLPTDEGYDVVIKRLEITRSDDSVVQSLGQLLIELRDDRMHVSQQARLINLGSVTYLFPEEGKLIKLPKGFVAFQSQPVMTDQRIEPVSDIGFKLKGSLPPGEVVLTWTYDMPVHGSAAGFRAPIGFRTFRYRAMVEAPVGLEASISGMPSPTLFENDGHRVLLSELQRRPTDPAFDQIDIVITGIPGPGPSRWVAVCLASLFLLGGIGLVFQKRGAARDYTKERAILRNAWLNEAQSLEAQFEKGDIGPEYKAQRMEDIMRHIAATLRDDARAK